MHTSDTGLFWKIFILCFAATAFEVKVHYAGQKHHIFTFLTSPSNELSSFVADNQSSCEAEKLFENLKLGFPIGACPRPCEPTSE